jgi:hypothetical protein
MNFLPIFLLNFIIEIITHFNVKAEQLELYSIQNNFDVDQTIASNWLINKFTIASRINCLASCNRNSLCISLNYNSSDGTCSIYSREFISTELVSKSNSDYYLKSGKLLKKL